MLKRALGDTTEENWSLVEAARLRSEKAWLALERHISAHGCLEFFPPKRQLRGTARHRCGTSRRVTAAGELRSAAPDRVLEGAADAALDLILVADDARRLVDFNRAAAATFGLPRDEVVGRRIEDFFSEAQGEPVSTAWSAFVAEGVQSGVCELVLGNHRRRFEYRARANFAPGLHLSVLRELSPVLQ